MLLQSYEQECEQLRLLYTNENDRLRKKLAAANKQLSLSFEMVHVLSSIIQESVSTSKETIMGFKHAGSFMAALDDPRLEDCNSDVTQ